MSLALAHFAFGAAMTTLVVTFLVPTVWYPRTVILTGGLWAMIPDFHWVSPIAREQLRHVHETSMWTDIFWMHRSLDRLDPGDSHLVAAGFLGLLIVSTAIGEYREYEASDRIRSTYESSITPDEKD